MTKQTTRTTLAVVGSAAAAALCTALLLDAGRSDAAPVPQESSVAVQPFAPLPSPPIEGGPDSEPLEEIGQAPAADTPSEPPVEPAPARTGPVDLEQLGRDVGQMNDVLERFTQKLLETIGEEPGSPVQADPNEGGGDEPAD